ncbi:MAG: hypothetical protein JW953_08875 [Anaerolineae bacterium]|nr:hypothetical protein [Anaerolineae bacterium]
MKKQLRLHLIVIGFYLLLALILTWPLAVHLTSHIPGEATWAFDEATFIWNMWWFKFSLLNLQQTPLVSTYIFFPLGVNLTTYTFNLFNAAFGLPLQLAFSLPLAQNLALLFSYVSSAYGMFLLSLYLLYQTNMGQPAAHVTPPTNMSPTSYLAAFAAGSVYAFSASRMMYVALGHYNFVTIQWFPFYTLFLLKTLRDGNIKKHILTTSLFAAFCLYAELTYSVFLIFITLLVVGGEWVKTWKQERRSNSALIKTLSALALIVLFTLIFTAPFVLSVLPDFLDPAYAQPGWGEGLKLSADLAGLFTLTPLHPLAGVDWITELRAVIEGTGRFNDANTLFLGYGILALALLGFAVRRKQGWVWLGGVIIFTILSLGPLLTINGQNRFNLDGLEVTFPLPFALLHYLPVLNAHRVPNRFGIPLSLSMAVLVGFAIAWLLGKLEIRNKDLGQDSGPKNRHFLISIFSFFILLSLLLFDQYSVPLPLTDARIPEIYYQIGAEANDFTLLQLPLGWRNSYGTLGAERTQLQYYQAAHHRPILGGNTSRNPAFKFDYYANIPLFSALTETELYRSVDEITLARARQQAAELMALYNVKYLVIHSPIEHRKPYEDTFLATRTLAFDLIPHQPVPRYQTSAVEAFAIEQTPLPNPLILDFGDWTSDPYRGEGWASNEEIFAATANWATDTTALVFFPRRGSGNRQLSIHLAPFDYPGMPEQTLQLTLNGHPLPSSFSLNKGWQTIETVLPETYLQEGLNRLTLRFAHTAQPRRVLPANRAVGGTGAETPVDLEVNSSSDFAFVTVGFGAEAIDASAHRRGVNLAVIDLKSGQVVKIKGFDTAANEFEAAALSQFITDIPPGHIVIVATQGTEAAAFFTTETLAALQTLGLSSEHLNPPFSAIGVKGAGPGTALQTSGDPAYLRLGAAPDVRNLAAAVDKIIISQRD